MKSLVYASLLSLGLVSVAFAQGMRGGQVCCAAVAVPLTAQETADLTYMREEEKLARDLYSGLGDFWNAPVFANIAQSETRHFSAIGSVLTRYRVPDPALPGTGLFANAELQALYDDLLNQGKVSLTAAFTAGALVEEVDIQDLDVAIANTEQPDLLRTYANLMCGSRNHLRAFVVNLELLGVVYDAQALPQESVDAILAVAMERCGSGRN